ncbi:MAG: hypothetical protein AMXMBFR13_41480 [Phycisphaerae bacterium]
MKTIDVVAAVLVVVGALNWGLVGILRFDLVAALLGDGSVLSSIVYALVGLAGLYQVFQWKSIQRRWRHEHTPALA